MLHKKKARKEIKIKYPILKFGLNLPNSRSALVYH